MSVSCFSLSSEPSARPCGFSAFKVSAVLKDPVLQQEYKKSNPSLQRALTAAGVDLEAQVGVLLKYGSNQLDEHHYHVLDSYNISCRSFRGPLDPSSEYVGMVLYSLDNETEWTANGVRVKSGYIYFREFSDIKDIQSSQGQVHGKLYKSLFNTDPEVGLIASGFAIRNGQWRFNSGTFNFWQPSRYTMDSTEQIFIKEAVEKFATTGQKIHTIASKADKFLVVDRGALSHMSDMLGAALTLEGQRELSASNGARGSHIVLFRVAWMTENAGQYQSILVGQPPHYLVYQLLLDIEALTPFPADMNALTLRGTVLQWHERLCSAGAQEGDVLVLMAKEAVEVEAPARPQITGAPADRIAQFLQQLSLHAPVTAVEE